MKRFGKILCGFGLVEFVCAVVAFVIFEKLPYPFGLGTSPGGMMNTADFDKFKNTFDSTFTLEANVCTSIMGAGLLGALFMLTGFVVYAIARLAPRKI